MRLKQKPREAACYRAEPEFIHPALSGSTSTHRQPFSLISIHGKNIRLHMTYSHLLSFTRDTCLLKSIYLRLKYSHLSYLSLLLSPPMLQICLRFNYWKTSEIVQIADTKGCPVPGPPRACPGMLPMLGTADMQQDHAPALSPLPCWCFLLDSGAEQEESIRLQSRVAELEGGSLGGNISTQGACRKKVAGKQSQEIKQRNLCSKHNIEVSPKTLLKKPRIKIIHAV